MNRSHRLCRASRRLWSRAEVLEARQLLAGQVTFTGAAPIDSFAGVGFALNPVATLVGSNNGTPDNTVGDYQVQVNWGDGSGFSSAGVELVSLGGGAMLVKGTHTYQTPNSSYAVTIEVSGPGGSSDQGQATSGVVTQMPDAASRPPAAPATEHAAQPLGTVALSVVGTAPIDSFAGVGFALNPIGTVFGSYNGAPDNTVGDYQAQVNWGDSPQWSNGAGLVSTGAGAMLIKATHIYQEPGSYDVTVYVTGPDGQTVSSSTTSVVVTQMPDAASRPPASPATEQAAQPLGTVSLSIVGAAPIDSFAGVGFALNPIGTVFGSYNGAPDNAVGDYHAQINWGDSPGWSNNTGLVSSGDGAVLIKATHIYQGAGTYDVTVYVTGPDGQTISNTATTAVVTEMPDAASLPPDAPTPESGAKPPGIVSLSIIGAAPIHALTGEEITSAPVGTIQGSYNGGPDNSVGDYHVQINWGDSRQWVAAQVLSSPGGSTVATFGSYTYREVGTYDVTVYVTGPDGQTASQTTTAVTVDQGPTPPPASSPPPPDSTETPTSTPTPGDVFELAYQFIRDSEGGLSDVKGDPGGLTKFGVTQSAYNAYRRSLDEKPQSVRLISEAEVRDIFENRLWIATGADKLAPLLGIVQLDTEVNFGTGGYNPKKHIKGAAAFLQETLDAARPGETDLELAQDYINLRIAWRYERVKFVPSQKKFLQGWLNRDNALKLYVAQLAPMFGQ